MLSALYTRIYVYRDMYIVQRVQHRSNRVDSSVQAQTITGLDPNWYMHPLAAEACEAAGFSTSNLTLVEGTAEAMPFQDNAFDSAICTLTLCSVKDTAAALGEMQRVVRPGGRVLFLEHVQAPAPGSLRLQQSLFDPLQRALADGCHLTRDTGAAIEAMSWQALGMQRFSVEGFSLISPHVSAKAIV
jgi:SAM-dependent methyltransferase